MSRKSKLVSISCALAVGLGGTTAAQAAEPQLELLTKPADRFHRTIETQRLEARYRSLWAEARDLGLEAKPDPGAAAQSSPGQLRVVIDDLHERVAKAEAKAESTPDYGPVAGVSQSTLDTIAACESGGDPTAVDASGTYFGKYQFDLGTWASVGGSGNPADASEAEQDYRASQLYSQAGSSPWPVCGA